jgi:uncharacterized protein YcfJ
LARINDGDRRAGYPEQRQSDEEILLMRAITVRVGVAASALAAMTAGAMAQNPYADDMACRQYADQATAGLRSQAAGQTVGGTLLGAGLGAALGAAIGGGRGAAIGAASGAIVGTGAGAANAQNADAYYQQQYYAYYNQCMTNRGPPPPAYAPAPAYSPAYAPRTTTQDLNQQELNRVQSYPPPGYPYPR